MVVVVVVVTFLVPAYPGCPGKETVKGCSSTIFEPLIVNSFS